LGPFVHGRLENLKTREDDTYGHDIPPLKKGGPPIVTFSMGHLGARRKSPWGTPVQKLSRPISAPLLTSCSVMDIKKNKDTTQHNAMYIYVICVFDACSVPSLIDSILGAANHIGGNLRIFLKHSLQQQQ